MARIGLQLFVELAGDAPPGLTLPPLKSGVRTEERIRHAFKPALLDDARVAVLKDLNQLVDHTPPSKGIALIYVFGHAWTASSNFQTAAIVDGRSQVLSGAELLNRLRPIIDGSDGMLFVDTCHASALRHAVDELNPRNWTIIFGSGSDESAVELTLDGSRLSETLQKLVSDKCKNATINIAELAVLASIQLRKATTATPPQTVEFWIGGNSVSLQFGNTAEKARAVKTHLLLRSILLSMGAVTAAIFVAVTGFFYSHFLLEINVGDLGRISSASTLEIWRQDPKANSEVLVESDNIGARSLVRLKLPEDNLIVKLRTTFSDGQPRSLALHLSRAPGWNWKAKQISWSLPTSEEIFKHPHMAWIPPGSWLSGPGDGSPRLNSAPYWIDLQPVTVGEYLPIAKELIEEGVIEDSMLLHQIDISSAAENVLPESVPKLLNDLNRISAVIKADETIRNKAQGQKIPAVPTADAPCDKCPAPMTKEEAIKFCELRHMRIPTALEWELAARGADGRKYPWGNRWDPARGNAGLPIQVGIPMKILAVDAMPSGVSPFGLIDTVANAGDWVEDEDGYSKMFAGGLYTSGEDDVTVYEKTPDTSDVFPNKTITTRCVSTR